jgi:hypothetical protein
MWNDCSGVIVWMSQPSWPSLVWNFYSWNYDPDASLFGAQKGAEPVHIQMSLPECRVAVINHRARTLEDATVTATIYDLSGQIEQARTNTVTAGADACTQALALDWPAHGCHFAHLELRDHDGKLLSENFYWHAREDKDVQELNSLPKVKLEGELHTEHGAVTGRVTNTGAVPALAVHLTLCDSKTGQHVLPVYYDDNYFSLLPGESRNFRIEFDTPASRPRVDITGWNIEPNSLH